MSEDPPIPQDNTGGVPRDPQSRQDAWNRNYVEDMQANLSGTPERIEERSRSLDLTTVDPEALGIPKDMWDGWDEGMQRAVAAAKLETQRPPDDTV